MPLEHTVSIQASQAHKMQSASMYGIFFIQYQFFFSVGYFRETQGICILWCKGLTAASFPLQNIAAESREQYRQVSSKLVEKSHELSQISDELDRVKHEMEERGSSITDGSE